MQVPNFDFRSSRDDEPTGSRATSSKAAGGKTKLNLNRLKTSFVKAPIYKISFLMIALAVGLQITPWPWLQSIGRTINFLATIAIALKFIFCTPLRWANVVSFLLWTATAFSLCVLLLMFSQGAIIYTDMARSFAPSQPAINFYGLGSAAVRQWGVPGFVLSNLLSFLAAGLQTLKLTAFAALGLALYVAVTAAEVGPVILRSSPLIMRNVIQAMSQFKQLALTGDEHSTVKALIRDHNEYYTKLLRTLDWARLVAYGIDIVVVTFSTDHFFLIAPWSEVQFTFNIFDSIAWPQVFRALILVGFFEVATRFTIAIIKSYRLSIGKAY